MSEHHPRDLAEDIDLTYATLQPGEKPIEAEADAAVDVAALLASHERLREALVLAEYALEARGVAGTVSICREALAAIPESMK